jgi:hypothetical protein
LLFDGVGARFGNLAILRAGATRNSDGPDELAVRDNRNTAINRNCACETQQAKTLPATGYTVLEDFGWTPEQGRRIRFLDRQGDTSCLCVLHFFKIHQIAPGIDDGYRVLPIVFPRLGNCGGGRVFGAIDTDR